MSTSDANKARTSMRSACTKTWHHKWHLYGARGVTVDPVCSESFTAWWEFVSQLPGCAYDTAGQRVIERISLDRINPFGHYEPGNVRWASTGMQNRNRRDRYQWPTHTTTTTHTIITHNP